MGVLWSTLIGVYVAVHVGGQKIHGGETTYPVYWPKGEAEYLASAQNLCSVAEILRRVHNNLIISRQF